MVRAGKIVGLDGCDVDSFKRGLVTVVGLFVRLINVSFRISMLSVVWASASVVSLYTSKDDKYECTSFRDLLSVACSLR